MASHNEESPALNGGRAPRNALLGGLEHTETTPKGSHDQAWTEARRCENIARHCARDALGQRADLAFQRAALGRHYARRAAALMLEAAQ
jgi:hypothetical protein